MFWPKTEEGTAVWWK